MNITLIVQSRMGSTRLPGKVLRPLLGQSMLAHVCGRAGRATTIGQVIVATSRAVQDDPIVDECRRLDVGCFRGSENDVLDRFYQAARSRRADVVIRVTGDCPMIDPGLIDRVVQEFLARQPEVHYACNSMPVKTYPRGLDTEVVRCDALRRAWREDCDPASREHVTPYIYRHPEIFRLHPVLNQVDYSALRWTVDTPDDWEFVRRVYEHFGHDRFGWEEVLSALAQHPHWRQINAHVLQKAS